MITWRQLQNEKARQKQSERLRTIYWYGLAGLAITLAFAWGASILPPTL